MVERWIVGSEPSKAFDFYTRANIGEVFPDPVVPFTYSFGFKSEHGLGGAEMGFRDAFLRIGAFEEHEFPPDEPLFLGVTGGYGYLNATAMRVFGHRAPGMSAADIDASFFGAAPGVPDFVVKDSFDRPDLTGKIGATFGWVLTTTSLDDVAEDERIMNALRAGRADLASLTDRELIGQMWHNFDTHFRRLFGQHIYITFLATLPVGIITGVCQAVGRPDAIMALIAGLGDVESAAPALAMWELGRQVAASPALGAAFDRGVKGLDQRLRVEATNTELARFVADFDAFLFDHGSRGPNEWEGRSPTWETQPDLALAAIDRMRLAPPSAAPVGLQAERATQRQALGQEIAAMLAADPATQGQFQAALQAATVFLPGRERTKTNCVKLIQESRMLLREFGRRMVAAGHFPRIESFGMLTRDEFDRVLDDPTGWYGTLVEREKLYEEVSALQEPFLFSGDPPPMSSYPRRDSVVIDRLAAGAVLQGMPGCPGKAVGRARIVLDSHDPGSLAAGDVLVAPITDPSWTPLFVAAAAVIVDVGAPLSHAIIVSRELGIPCVVSVTGATRSIPDGALVEVDGNTGQVTILEG
ncbi:MAG: PEP-utilizing enzyme [Acidimicrobiales bacterium]